MMKKLIHLQPFVPHYREEFFRLLGKRLKEEGVGGELMAQEVYTYENTDNVKSAAFSVGDIACKHIPNKLVKGKILFYNPFPLLKKENEVLVLMLNFAHITTWILLLTKWLHHKKIILWGQGISVRRYLKEEKHPDWKLKGMIALADGVWLYMDKELEQWRQCLPGKPMVALRNTLTGVDEMVSSKPTETVAALKEKYGITQDIVFIFCARFTDNRRVDLLLETIRRLDTKKYGFVIIGAGNSKPDFSTYKNVYDFGAVYDKAVKRELFALADVYFQPGWVGLSIVEAMAYGKPIFTFERSEKTLQCVEYSYIRHGENGMILQDMEDCISTIKTMPQEEMKRMGENAREYVKDNLRIEQMVGRGMSLWKQMQKQK